MRPPPLPWLLVAWANSFAGWAVAAVLLGAGTARVCPTMPVAVGDVAHPARARAVEVLRLWWDGVPAVGALLARVLADAPGVRVVVWAVAALTAASGVAVAVRVHETLHTGERQPTQAAATPSPPTTPRTRHL